MSQNEYDAAIAAFIRNKGVTRCPTACAVRTQGTVSESDREALQKRAAQVEIQRIRRRGRDPLAAFHPNPQILLYECAYSRRNRLP